MSKLAILGGPKTVLNAPPHFPWPIITKEVEKAVIKQLHESVSIYNRSGIIADFEDDFRSYHKIKHALLTSSGTAALHTMYVAANMGEEDEIICPAYTFYATVTPILQTGAIPVLCDADETGNIDPNKIEQLITPHTKAVVVTHMWGIPCQMDKIAAICKKHKLLLFEDCSHAHGARYQDKLVGTWGDAAAWSLQGQKIVTGGEGGVFATDNTEFYIRALLFGHYNKRCVQEIPKEHPLAKYAISGMGLKLRSHPLAVAIAKVLFKHLDDILLQKRKYISMFKKELKGLEDFISMPVIPNKASPSWYALTLTYNKSGKSKVPVERFLKALQAEGCLEADIPNSTCPLNLMPLFQDPSHLYSNYKGKFAYKPGQFPVAEKFSQTRIKFPVWTRSKDISIVKKYIKAIRKVVINLKELE
ncbi:DegT/DnrJ/EryC1/StrS family aminotransferase [Patescibacteria group bacterium]|nr:DegT/DnrJ/EryC1/StrS family aminotransferase [Patescibacteria group bacterium]MBU1500003.1 DegT/DnrJ/EryC1/StrS family aminotransferase [Patescibacteria group bacterium]